MQAAQKLIIIKPLKSLLYLIALLPRFLFGLFTGLVALRHDSVVSVNTLFQKLDLAFQLCGSVGLELPRVDHAQAPHDQESAEIGPQVAAHLSPQGVNVLVEIVGTI